MPYAGNVMNVAWLVDLPESWKLGVPPLKSIFQYNTSKWSLKHFDLYIYS